MGKFSGKFDFIKKSKFMRSVFLQVLAIFLIVSIAIVVVVFFSFTSEIKQRVLTDRQKQLSVIETTITNRMSEISSIAYNIGKDPSFYMEPVEGVRSSSYEMSTTLGRYLVGNGFIEYLAYYRLSEPDKIYTAKGELSFRDFWGTYLGLDEETADTCIQQIQSITDVEVVPLSFGADKSFFAYVCPLPQFSANPQAYVLILIPLSEIQPLLETQIATSNSAIAVYDAGSREIFRMNTLGEEIALDPSMDIGEDTVCNIRSGGNEYAVQKHVSSGNGWTYLSATRMNDIISGMAGKELLFIITLLGLMLLAIFTMLMCIVIQYKPISNLAVSVSGNADSGDNSMVDETNVLSNTLATLQDNSNQKQKFETAFYEAEAASKAKSVFLSNMSHDIRTPMNAITGMTAMAARHAEDAPYVKDCLEKVQTASRYLLDIINNVLDMSRIESGKFTLSQGTVSLPKLINELTAILNQSVQAKRQHFLVEATGICNETVTGDNVRLMQVLMNILSNAVKFTPDGGTIRLHIKQTAQTEDGFGDYVFSVSDTGIGMPPEFVAKVFDAFSRASASGVSQIEGTGLGMSIAKNLVEQMGGTICCESELGKGSTFIVTLHLPLVADDVTRGTAADRYAGMRVLIVDGDACRRDEEVRVCGLCGLVAQGVPDAATAAETAVHARETNCPFRLLLLHPSDADPDGLSAMGTLSAVLTPSETTCLLMANDPAELRQTEARAAGISSFVQLPLFQSTVFAFLNRIFDSEHVAEKAEVPSSIQLAGRKILVAEDNELNREIVRKILSETGAEVFDAIDGREALNTYLSHPVGYFDVILMDIHMPVMDGCETTRSIRSSERPDAKLPIYALTASTFEEDLFLIRENGMDGYLAKPYTPEMLYTLLKSIFN